jgi:hypothetical protein
MKINDILIERDRSGSIAWRNDAKFASKLRVVRDFLRSNGDSQVASIYQQAANDRRFMPDDVQYLQQKMDEAGVDARTIRSLTEAIDGSFTLKSKDGECELDLKKLPLESKYTKAHYAITDGRCDIIATGGQHGPHPEDDSTYEKDETIEVESDGSAIELYVEDGEWYWTGYVQMEMVGEVEVTEMVDGFFKNTNAKNLTSSEWPDPKTALRDGLAEFVQYMAQQLSEDVDWDDFYSDNY